MKYLKTCPKCQGNLELHSDGETQYCNICSYWTKTGTARLDSIMIYG
jgi:primosomal protein N'